MDTAKAEMVFDTDIYIEFKKWLFLKHMLQVCNGIGTTVDSKLINLEAKYVTMNASFILVASNNAFMVTRYVIPSSSLRDKQASASSNDELYGFNFS